MKQQLSVIQRQLMIEKSSGQNTKAGITGHSGGDISKQGTSTHAAETADTEGRSSCEWKWYQQCDKCKLRILGVRVKSCTQWLATGKQFQRHREPAQDQVHTCNS